MATTLIHEDNNMEYEVDKEKVKKRGDIIIPFKIKNSIPLSSQIDISISPVIAMRQLIRIEEGEKKNVYILTSANYSEENAIENLNEYTNIEKLNNVFELSKAQTEAENRYMEIDADNIILYQKMLKELLYGEIKDTNIEDLSNEKIWKFGISGDFPILLVKLKDVNEIYVAKEVLKAYQFFISKNIKMELVFATEIDLMGALIESRLDKRLNVREGIFIVNNATKEDKKILEARANLVIDSHYGLLKYQI